MPKQSIKQVIKENLEEFFIIMVIMSIVTFLFYVSDIKCLIKYTVGIPCPGCGLTRAWLSFFKMDLRGALRWHPLFWIVPFIIIIGVFVKGKVFENKRANRMLWLLLAILVLGVYCVRMIRLFPDHAPMEYNKQSLLYKGIVFLNDKKRT